MWQGFLLNEWTWHSQKRQAWDTNIVEDISYLFLGCDVEEQKNHLKPHILKSIFIRIESFFFSG